MSPQNELCSMMKAIMLKRVSVVIISASMSDISDIEHEPQSVLFK